MYNNNKQLFWEVKQFMTKPQLSESIKPAKSSLLDTVKNVLNSSNNTKTPPLSAVDGIVNSGGELKEKTGMFLNTFSGKMEKQNPTSPAYTKNLTTNMFNLNEEINLKKPKTSFEKIIGQEAQNRDREAKIHASTTEVPGSAPPKLERKTNYAIPGAVSASELKKKMDDIKNLRLSIKELMAKRDGLKKDSEEIEESE